MHNPKLDAFQRQRQQSHAERLFGKEASLPPPPVAVETRAEAESGAKTTADGDVVRKS